MHFSTTSKIDLQKHLLAIVLLASLASYQVARAQKPLHFPSPELAIPGVAEKSPISATSPRRVRNPPLLFFGGTAVHPDQSRLRELVQQCFGTFQVERVKAFLGRAVYEARRS